MQEPYSKRVAIYTDPESCVACRKVCDEALTGAHAGRVLSRVIIYPVRSADALVTVGRQHCCNRYARLEQAPRGRRPRARMVALYTGTGRSHNLALIEVIEARSGNHNRVRRR